MPALIWSSVHLCGHAVTVTIVRRLHIDFQLLNAICDSEMMSRLMLEQHGCLNGLDKKLRVLRYG